MRIIKPSCDVIQPKSPYEHIEIIGRTCYKSESLITETSAKPFCERMVRGRHHAMIEHFRFIVKVNKEYYDILSKVSELRDNMGNKYITMTKDDVNGRYIISASARGFNDLIDKKVRNLSELNVMTCIEDIVRIIIERYNCGALFNEHLRSVYNIINTNRLPTRLPISIIDNFDMLTDDEYKMHAWYSVHFVCDRGVTHEMVRHRDASFAQESTRYCNYSKGKFGNEITVIKPMFWEEDSEEYKLWWMDCKHSEETYNSLIKLGASPQEARSILPNSLKTEIIVTAQVYEWEHIFNLRLFGTTGAPHPQIREVMEMALNKMIESGYKHEEKVE